jgi:two-component system response regulator PilR (NtrC family)
MPGKTGLDLLRAASQIAPETVVIMITAFASADSAIEAMKEGAYDYVTKPFKVDEIRLVVEKALEKKLLSRDNRRLRTELRSQAKSRAIIGNSDAIQHVFDLVTQVAETRTHVLISGESGTGKELVARAIHEQSERQAHPFVAVNCGAIPENLLESELFGHVKGAFTGALQNKEGLFETAEAGTLFLDEVGELPFSLQVKLLRAIQEKVVRRVGATSDRRVDVRILSATNRSLDDEVAAGRFREDLYYRLNVIQISLPPLRERRDDIPLLLRHFIDKYNRELSRSVDTIDEAAMAKLMAYHYPGNVRELENVVERALALSRDSTITVDALPPTLSNRRESRVSTAIPPEGVDLDELLAEYERALLREALQLTHGVKKHAAQLLRVTFRSFRYRLDKLGLDDDAPS